MARTQLFQGCYASSILAGVTFLLAACSGGGVYPEPTDAGATDVVYRGSSTSSSTGAVAPSGPPRRDSGGNPADWYTDAGQSACMCAWAVYVEPPYVCFRYFCLGDACIETGFVTEGRCFYTGHDPAP